MNDVIEVTRVFVDRPMFSVYLLFKHKDHELEHPQDLTYSARHGIFRLASDNVWEKYDHGNEDSVEVFDFYKAHPELSRSDVLLILEQWLNDNQEHVLDEVMTNMPEFVDNGNDNGYFAQHCGYTYLGIDLIRLLSNEIDRKHFEKAYKSTYYCGQEFSDFDRTLKVINDDGLYVGTSSLTEDFRLEFNGFFQTDFRACHHPFSIKFDTDPYDLN